MAGKALDAILDAVAAGDVHPVYLVRGDLVLAEPAAQRIADALAERAGCHVESHRRPAALAPLLQDLRTYSLFDPAKVLLAVDTAVFADRDAAADLVDQAEDALPIDDPSVELGRRGRAGAGRLLQALRICGLDPAGKSADELLEALPEWALKGGRSYRKQHPRGRSAKRVKALLEGLRPLLEAAQGEGLRGVAEGDQAELGEVIRGGLPEGHALVLAEHSVTDDHPVVSALEGWGTVLGVGRVTAGRGGDWQGVEALASELEHETGTAIERGALAELARRTLRQKGDWRNKSVDAESTARLAAEYRKLASLAAGGKITRELVAEVVEDRGEEDVWQILDAVGEGRGDLALQRFHRYLASADDATAARLSFFALLAGFCRQLVAVAGVARVHRVPAGVRSYSQFKSRWADALKADLPQGGKNPLAGLHPFRLHRAYLAASRMDRALLPRLPWLVLETEMQIKGESGEPDAAIAALMARLTAAVGGGQSRSRRK